MRRIARTLIFLSVFGLLACLPAFAVPQGESYPLLAFAGPAGTDPRSMPPLAAVHPLVVASLQVLVSLMALIAFPVRREEKAERE